MLSKTCSKNETMKELEEKIGYYFQDIHLLFESLTHSSYANENKKKNIAYNERLEFLGDAVLSIVISEHLYNKLNTFQEGELTKIRASIVCEPSLANCSKNLNIGKYILLGKGEEVTGGRERVSILADTFEAIIGAIYLDGGLGQAQRFILKSLKDTIEDAISGRVYQDYKTHLQEYIQSENSERILYEVIHEEGPDHNKIFHVHVKVGEKILGTGIGRSKKEAEQSAAKEALKEVQ
ncbi:ribonuclease III [Geosporobacter ferrireducens]|uniref:Ribonuclease 3 n=1 Tax=Geosporobacter ferrireducens TaxID=1424294 RepID=A0A1D8GBV0_9FIRM|nr:ribonuclease III [Geosporobacter ferrireducens]AOT68391.1 ribonuclease III [Geosporobacter ferrireducens]MTI53840.1 ribonuclease III [Geosporobacter ferrireducens]